MRSARSSIASSRWKRDCPCNSTTTIACDAAQIEWSSSDTLLSLTIEDNGSGLASDANLFVPIFATKPKGNGICLVLCRQTDENHGGELTLKNRTDSHRCEATLRLPL